MSELPLVRSGKTGGTTGEPLVFFTDAHRSASVWAAFYRYYDWIGVSLASSKLIIWGQPIVNNSIGKSFKSYIVNHLSNSKYLDAFRISDKHFDEYAAAFKRHKPVLVRGYTQSMYELALIFKKHGFQYPLYGLSCTVEPLFEGYRQVFRDVFFAKPSTNMDAVNAIASPSNAKNTRVYTSQGNTAQ